jgi:hypothetical protein
MVIEDCSEITELYVTGHQYGKELLQNRYPKY